MVANRRNRLPGGGYVFTVTLLDRSSGLLTKRIDDLCAVFRSVRRERPFTIDAMVVLPDHLHCIWNFCRRVPTDERCLPAHVKKG